MPSATIPLAFPLTPRINDFFEEGPTPVCRLPTENETVSETLK